MRGTGVEELLYANPPSICLASANDSSNPLLIPCDFQTFTFAETRAERTTLLLMFCF